MNIISRQISVLKNLYRERIAARPSYQPSPSLGDHERALLDELRRNGIVIVKDFLKPEEADTIRQLLESQISSLSSEQWVDVRKKQDAENLKWGVKLGNAWSFWVNVFQSDFRIMGSEHIAPIIHQFAYHDLITTVGSEYLKEDLKLSFCMANKTVYKPNIPGSGGGWHRDRNYKNGFKAERHAGTFRHQRRSPRQPAHGRWRAICAHQLLRRLDLGIKRVTLQSGNYEYEY